MRFFLSILTVTLVFSPALAQGEGGTDGVFWVLLKPTAEVSGSHVTVGDIGEVGGLDPALAARVARIVVAPTPACGRTAVITHQTLESILKKDRASKDARFALRGPTSVMVTPRTVRMSSEQIVHLVRAHLGDRIDARRGGSSLTLGPTPPDLMVPAGRYSTRFSVVEPEGGIPYAGTFRVQVVAVVDGRPSTRCNVTMSLKRRGHVLVASEDLDPRQPMTRSLVKIEEREIFSAQGGILTDPAEIEGHFPRIRLREGQVLMKRDFRGPPVVFRNDVVTILLDAGALSIRSEGRSLGEGAIGETILVRTGKRQRTVKATIIDSQTVRVELAARAGTRSRKP